MVEIPQIKPTDSGDNEVAADTTAPAVDKKESGESLQMPKINLEVTDNQITQKMNFKEKITSIFKKKPKVNQPMDGKKKKILISIGVASVVFLLLVILPSLVVISSGKKFLHEAMAIQTVASSQDIGQIKTQITTTKKSLAKLQGSYKWISWMRIVPFFGSYIKDASHGLKAASAGMEAGEILLATIEPYADVIGLTGGASQEGKDGEKTTEERIDFIVQTIPDLVPRVDELAQKAEVVKKELSSVNPNRYPVKLGDTFIRDRLKKGIELVNSGATYAANAKPLLEATPYLLGIEKERNYLILFQNDKELRPTGGFLTAYSIAKVSKGKFEPVISSDIYDLDARYTPVIQAPEPIVTYIKGPYILSENIRLRDINWSSDLAVSMADFTKEAEGVGLPEVDGIIMVDTKVLEYLLDAIGGIGVPGFGNFSTDIIPECNCPQVIYELESFADVEGPIIWDPLTGEIIYRPPNSDNRKKIIGPLMNSVLANAMGSPKEKLAGLFEAGFKSIIEKHVMFYMFDEDVQKAVTEFGIGGTISDYEGDYLHISDANLGGRKSNLYVTQEVEQEVEIAKDGTVTKTVNITYKNPEKHDGWLNSVLPNWTRIYVPKGSELIDMAGLDDRAEPYEEFDKTVFAGHFELRPEGVVKISVSYKLPFKVTGDYKLLIQKQPGTDKPLHIVKVGKQQDEFFLLTDKELSFGL